MMDEEKEEWRTFPPPFDGYKVSNYGRLISPKGRELKPYPQKSRLGTVRAVCTLKIERRGIYIRKVVGVAVEVYRYFGEGYFDGVHIYHKDGDPMNNRLDNLYICGGYINKPSKEQEAHIPEILACVKHCMWVNGYTKYARRGMDTGNVIGNAVFECWRHLPQYRTELSFYGYCKHYTKLAFLTEYVKWKKLCKFVSIEALADEI